MKKKTRVILLIVLGVPLFCLHMFAIFLVIDMETDVMPLPFDYDDPEPLLFLGQRTQQYIRRAYPKDSAERKEALQTLEDIALLDVSDAEKARLIRERFPEESFWTDDMKELLKQAESGDAEAQFQLGCFYYGGELGLPPDELKFLDMEIDEARGRCIEKSGYMSVKWFRRAALQGHVKAQNALAQSYLNGSHPVAGDRAFLTKKAGEMISGEVKKWCRMAVANGDPFVMMKDFDSPETSADVRRKRKVEAIDILREAARQGNVKAMLAAANEMRYIGDERQREEAEEWYRQAAELGSVEAMMEYADIYDSKEQKRRREEIRAKQEEAEERSEEYEYDAEEIGLVTEEADRWRRKAFDVAMKHLDEGSAKDLYLWTDNMSYYIEPESSPLKTCLDEYLGEENTAAFLERTVQRLYDLLEQDNREIYYISRIISNVHEEFEGLEILQSDRPLIRYAEAGVPFYQSVLAIRTLNGKGEPGVPEDKPEAIRRLRIGAGFCSMAEERYLGEYCMNGNGVPQDTVEGVRWLKKAALHGSGDAMWLLRNHYRESWNPYQALKWTIRSELHYSYHYESPVEYCTDMLEGLWWDLGEAWQRFVNWLPW